jgi:hypothetical protein
MQYQEKSPDCFFFLQILASVGRNPHSNVLQSLHSNFRFDSLIPSHVRLLCRYRSQLTSGRGLYQSELVHAVCDSNYRSRVMTNFLVSKTPPATNVPAKSVVFLVRCAIRVVPYLTSSCFNSPTKEPESTSNATPHSCSMPKPRIRVLTSTQSFLRLSR